MYEKHKRSSKLTLYIKTVGKGIVGILSDADAPWSVLGIHADRASSRGRGEIGIECFHVDGNVSYAVALR